MYTTDRRSMLRNIGFAGAIAALPGCIHMSAPDRRFFARSGLPVGLQLYTLGPDAGKDIAATFAAVAAIGFRDIEVPGLYDLAPADLRKAAEAAGLTISCMHIPIRGMTQDSGLTLASETAQIVETAQALGIAQLVVPIMLFPDGARPRDGETFPQAIARAVAEAGPDLWRETADILNESAAALATHGIALGYHNHNVEFARFENETGWDILAARTDPALVKFEIDVGWVASAGLDPVKFLQAHKGRVRWLHVKDVAVGNTANFGLEMKPAEVGFGTLDWERILPAAHEAGVRHFYLEQEPPFTMPRIEAARKGYGFLEALVA